LGHNAHDAMRRARFERWSARSRVDGPSPPKCYLHWKEDKFIPYLQITVIAETISQCAFVGSGNRPVLAPLRARSVDPNERYGTPSSGF
jgi:hypothetical protein